MYQIGSDGNPMATLYKPIETVCGACVVRQAGITRQIRHVPLIGVPVWHRIRSSRAEPEPGSFSLCQEPKIVDFGVGDRWW